MGNATQPAIPGDYYQKDAILAKVEQRTQLVKSGGVDLFCRSPETLLFGGEPVDLDAVDVDLDAVDVDLDAINADAVVGVDEGAPGPGVEMEIEVEVDRAETESVRTASPPPPGTRARAVGTGMMKASSLATTRWDQFASVSKIRENEREDKNSLSKSSCFPPISSSLAEELEDEEMSSTGPAL